MRKNLFLLALPLLLSACAASLPPLPADNLVAPSFHQPPAASLIVLLPVEVDAVYLKPGSAMLMNALHQRLVAAGFKVVALDKGSHDAIWLEEIKEVGGLYDPITGALRPRELMVARGHLAQRVSAETHAALVIMPRLELREVELSGISGAWDGQQRRVAVYGDGGRTYKNSGSTLGMSVGLDLFAPSGEMVMRTHGGAALPYRVNVQTEKNEVRADLFANEKEVNEGVAIALMPFFKM